MQYRRAKIEGGTYFFTLVTMAGQNYFPILRISTCKSEFKQLITPSRLRKKEQAIWQRRFWEHVIRDEKDFTRHVEYIHYNPVKHGLVKAPKDWKYSSFHRYVRHGVYDHQWGSNMRIEFDSTVGRE